jgi:cell division protein FtsW (lipid II flippase)
MSLSNRHLQDFLHRVCNEIRFKSIQPSIIRELSDHIEDQKYEYINQGLDEESATIQAIEQMGDPAVVGKQLNNAHKPRTEWTVLTIAASLVIIGGIIQYFLSGVSENTLYLFPRFLLYAPIGITTFVLIYFFDYMLLGRYSKHLYFILLTLTVIGFFVFRQQNGTYSHVFYSSLLFIPVLAGIVYSLKHKGYLGIVLSVVFYAGAAILCLLAPSLTSYVILTLSFLIILTVSVAKGFFHCNKKIAFVLIYLPIIIMVLLIIASLQEYQYARLAVMLNPERDPLGAGYISIVIRNLITSAKPIGTVILDSNITNASIERFLPEWSTDFSLTYIIAKLGYIPGISIITMMFALICRMIISVYKQKHVYGFLVSLSACLAITIQIVLYILSNLGIIMPLSLTLPFISFGAYSFIVNMALIGLLLSIYRRTDLISNKIESKVEH